MKKKKSREERRKKIEKRELSAKLVLQLGPPRTQDPHGTVVYSAAPHDTNSPVHTRAGGSCADSPLGTLITYVLKCPQRYRPVFDKSERAKARTRERERVCV